MGYCGDFHDLREIKRFLKNNSSDPNYDRALFHLNTLMQSSYNKTAFTKSARPRRANEMLRASSTLISAHSTGKYIK
jgi:hypothetical protein